MSESLFASIRESGGRVLDHRWQATEGPTFSTTEVAKVFFGFSGRRLRQLFEDGTLKVEGDRFNPDNPDSHRRYNLYDIEDMAYALSYAHNLEGERLQNVLLVIYSIAKTWRLIA